MATSISFFLKDPKAKSETPVNLVMRFNYYEVGMDGSKNYKRFKVATGEKIHPDFWDSENHRAKQTRKFPEYPEFNQRLNDLESMVRNLYRKLVNDGIEPTPERLKLEFDLLQGKGKKEATTSLFGFIQTFIQERSATKKPNTLKSYRATLKQLQLYSRFTSKEMIEYEAKDKEEQEKLFTSAKIKKKIDFDSITLDFYYNFIQWNKEQGRSENYIGSLIKGIKVIMTEATDRGLNKNYEYTSKRFKVLQEESDNIALSEKELQSIMNLDLSQNERLDRVRDLFLISCNTGLRFQDFTEIRPENILKTPEGEIIKIRTRKTGKEVAIPISSTVRMILDKYRGNLPRSISNQKMNAYLKELGQLAGIEDREVKVITKGGMRVEITRPRYEMISCHTGRRTALTNMFRAGMDSGRIRLISGHTTEKSFLKYIKVSAEENAKNLISHPFFNQNTLKAV